MSGIDGAAQSISRNHSTDDLHVMDGSDDDMDYGLMDLLRQDSGPEEAQDREYWISVPPDQ